MVDLPPTTLEVFYSPICAPCRLELPVVAAFAAESGAHVRIVIVSDEARAREELHAVSPQLEAAADVQTTLSVGAALRAAGNSDGILPYARAVQSDGKVCAKWEGRLTLAKARKLVAACARTISRPLRQP